MKRVIDYKKLGITDDVRVKFYKNLSHLDLTYGLREINGFTPYFLLNRVPEEDEIVPLKIPYIVEDKIIIDLRMAAKKNLNDSLTIQENILDKEQFNLQILLAVLLTGYVKNDIRNNLLVETAYVKAEILAYLLKVSLNINPEEEAKIKAVVIANSVSDIYDLEKDETLSLLKHKISTMLPGGQRFNAEYVESAFKDFKPPKDIEGWTENILNVVHPGTKQRLNSAVLITLFTSLSFSISFKSLLGISLTNNVIWTAIMYVHATSKSFRNSKLNKILDSKRRYLKLNELLQSIDENELFAYKNILVKG